MPRIVRSPVVGPVWQCGGASVILRGRTVAVIAALCGLVLLVGGASLLASRIGLSFTDALATLATALTGVRTGAGDAHPAAVQILLQIRLSRVVAAIFVGAALGVAGAVFQSLTRNPLGSPDVIGFTAGAATGALLQIIVLDDSGSVVALSAMVGSLLASVTVYLLALKGGTVPPVRLVLVGIGVGAVLTAFNGLLIVHGHLDRAAIANLWLAGSLNARGWSQVLPVIAGVIVLLPVLLGLRSRLALIEMGEARARQLGVAVERTRITAMLAAVLLAALATAAAGPIAFIALAAPQLARRLTRAGGPTMIGAAVMGAALLTCADALTGALPFAATLPVGRVTSVLGGLYLLWLITRRGALDGRT